VKQDSVFTRPSAKALLLIPVVLGVAACGSAHGSGESHVADAKLSGSIVVSAASSLTGAFGQLRSMFESQYPGTNISFNFGSSGALATQIVSGAPADVFASASRSDMETVQKAGQVVGDPVTFARNSLEIVVKPGNPLKIHMLADLTKASVVAICVTTAPCGATAEEALRRADVDIQQSRISWGQDVDSTLSEVVSGDADAAIVYVTNARTVGAQGVAVPIPSADNVTTSYPIAIVKTTTQPSLAAAWIAFVVGPTGQRVLRAAGFLPAS
jgi:molybdate transport system substrate-binding protein